MPDPSKQLASLGRAVTQINLRLTRISEQLDDINGGAAPEPSAEPDVLFDLLDAVSRTLDTPAAVAQPRSLWQRLFSQPVGPSAELDGLRLAFQQAHAALLAQGLVAAPQSGPIDPTMHQVIGVEPTSNPALDGHIARVHRQGWKRHDTIVRLAQVTAWKATPSTEL